MNHTFPQKTSIITNKFFNNAKNKKIITLLVTFLFSALIGFKVAPLHSQNIAASNYIQLEVQHFSDTQTLLTRFRFKVMRSYHINAIQVKQNFLIPTKAFVDVINSNAGTISSTSNSNTLTTLWQDASLPITKEYFGKEMEVYENSSQENKWHEIVLHSAFLNSKKNITNMPVTLHARFNFQPCTNTICYPPMQITNVQKVQLKKLLLPPANMVKLAGKNSPQNSWSLVQITLAFIAGIILNLMPCVFPIIALKANTIAKLTQNSKTQQAKKFWHNTGLLLGIIFTFLLLAAIVATASYSSKKIGWGFQFQQSSYLISMILLTYLIGMEISGHTNFARLSSLAVARIAGRLRLSSLQQPAFTTASYKNTALPLLQGGGNGLVIVLLSTPCTAPIFTGVIAYAFAKTLPETFLIFFSLAVGFALPQILITQPFISRHIVKVLPKSGQWMNWLKKTLGFLMFITSAWLLTILASNALYGSTGSSYLLTNLPYYGTLVIIVMTSALLLTKNILRKKTSPEKETVNGENNKNKEGSFFINLHFIAKPVSTAITILFVVLPFFVAAILTGFNSLDNSPSRILPPTQINAINSGILPTSKKNNVTGATYEIDDLPPTSMPLIADRIKPLNQITFATAKENGNPIFVIITANWCLSCKWNEKMVLNTQKTKQLFTNYNVDVLVGDITTSNPFVQGMMQSLGFVAIPLYLFYKNPANTSPKILSPLLQFLHIEKAVTLTTTNK